MRDIPTQFPKGAYVGLKVNEHIFGAITTCETIFEEGLSSEWHFHSNPHFSHILSGGSKELRTQGSEFQIEGSGLYYYPGVQHQNLQYRKGTRIFNVELDERFFKDYDLNVPSEALMHVNTAPVNTNGLTRILKEHYCNDYASPISIDQLCIDLVQNQSEPRKKYPEWAQKIRTILNDHWADGLSLMELAKQLNIHPVTLSRYFSKYFGCSLGEYLRKIKVEHALALIRSKKYTLTEIAYHCNFTDQSHFIKTFYRLTGLLPKQYRRL